MTEALAHLKYLLFFTALILGVPIGYHLARGSKRWEHIVVVMLIFFTARMEDINFISRETFKLTTRGFEIGMVDLCTLILLLLVLNRKKSHPTSTPTGFRLFQLYIFFSLLSLINSDNLLFSGFELFKMFRLYLFYWVMFNYIRTREQLKIVLKGIVLVTIFIFLSVLKQRYLDGTFQTRGPFPHQNSLVMYMILFTSITLSHLLNNRKSSILFWGVINIMGVLTIIFTLSRAGIVLFAISAMMILLFSLFAELTRRKMIIFLLMIVGAALILGKTYRTITERFTTAPEESAEVRLLLAQAAVKMANDQIPGIGLNNFGIKINPPYPYSDHIEHPKKSDDEIQNGLVETIYLMIAAESGWHTLLIFLLWLLWLYWINFQNYRRYRGDPLQYLPIGLLGGLCAIYLESTLEWVLKQTNNGYQLILIFALIGVMERLYHERDQIRSGSTGTQR